MRIAIFFLWLLTLWVLPVVAAQEGKQPLVKVESLFFSKGHFYYPEPILTEAVGKSWGPYTSYQELRLNRFGEGATKAYLLPLDPYPTVAPYMSRKAVYRFHMAGDVFYHGRLGVDRLSRSDVGAIRLTSLPEFSEEKWQNTGAMEKTIADQTKSGNLWQLLSMRSVFFDIASKYYFASDEWEVANAARYSFRDPVPEIFVDYYPKDREKNLLFVLYSPNLPNLPQYVRSVFPAGNMDVFEAGPGFCSKQHKESGEKLISADLVKNFDGLKLLETIGTDMTEPFTVFVSGKDYFFVTESGKLYRRKNGQTKTELLWPGSEPPITTMISNTDSGEVFAFAEKKGEETGVKRNAVYFKLEDNVRTIPCTLEPIADEKTPESLRRIMPYSNVLVRDKVIQQAAAVPEMAPQTKPTQAEAKAETPPGTSHFWIWLLAAVIAAVLLIGTWLLVRSRR